MNDEIGMVNLTVKLNHDSKEEVYVLNNIITGNYDSKGFLLPKGLKVYNFLRLCNNTDELIIYYDYYCYSMLSLVRLFKAFFTLGTPPVYFEMETSNSKDNGLLLKVQLTRPCRKVENWDMPIYKIELNKNYKNK